MAMTRNQRAKVSSLNGLPDQTIHFSPEEIAFINRVYAVYEHSNEGISAEDDTELDRLYAIVFGQTPGIPDRLSALEARLASVEDLVSRG